jgi:hypothetical protein
MYYYAYLLAIWYICWLFGKHFRFGMLYQEKSGNPELCRKAIDWLCAVHLNNALSILLLLVIKGS